MPATPTYTSPAGTLPVLSFRIKGLSEIERAGVESVAGRTAWAMCEAHVSARIYNGAVYVRAVRWPY